MVTPGHATYAADATFRLCRAVVGARPPAITVIVEVMHSETWSTVRPKIDVYRNRPGVEYILCIKMSLDLQHWTYEFYDLGDDSHPPSPPVGQPAPRHGFYWSTERDQYPHVLTMESRRVLGLAPGANLPQGCPDHVQIDVVKVAQRVWDEDSDK